MKIESIAVSRHKGTRKETVSAVALTMPCLIATPAIASAHADLVYPVPVPVTGNRRIPGYSKAKDAITTDRPYQRRKTCAEAFAILRRMANHELCPDLVEAFVADIEENGMIDEEPAEDHIRLPLRVS
mgnify:CR=1 FL=1